MAPRVFVQHNTKHIRLITLNGQRQLCVFRSAPFGIGHLACPVLPQGTMIAIDGIPIMKATFKVINHPFWATSSLHTCSLQRCRFGFVKERADAHFIRRCVARQSGGFWQLIVHVGEGKQRLIQIHQRQLG